MAVMSRTSAAATPAVTGATTASATCATTGPTTASTMAAATTAATTGATTGASTTAAQKEKDRTSVVKSQITANAVLLRKCLQNVINQAPSLCSEKKSQVS